VFRKDGKKLLRFNNAGFQPFDDFCAVWHLFDLLPGDAEWSPKFNYD
jgi:hypothetical protein